MNKIEYLKKTFINKKIGPLTFIPLLLIFVSIHSCTPVEIKHFQYLPYNDREIANILLSLKNQETAVHSFFSCGSITFQGQGSEFEASVLAVGTKKPYKIKIEVSHFWGRPLFHMMIKEKKIFILSFLEKQYRVGNIGGSVNSHVLPVRLGTNQLWALGRGFPILTKYHDVTSPKGNQISLLSTENEMVQQIDFYPESDHPQKSLVPEQGLEVSFSNFEDNHNIRFARKTQLFDQKTQSLLKINIKKMVFNKTIDESIFDLAVPPDFKRLGENQLLDTQ